MPTSIIVAFNPIVLNPLTITYTITLQALSSITSVLSSAIRYYISEVQSITSTTIAKNSCYILDGLRPYNLLRASTTLKALSTLPIICSLYYSPQSIIIPRILTNQLGSTISRLNYRSILLSYNIKWLLVKQINTVFNNLKTVLLSLSYFFSYNSISLQILLMLRSAESSTTYAMQSSTNAIDPPSLTLVCTRLALKKRNRISIRGNP